MMTDENKKALLEELGSLTYQRAKLEQILKLNIERSNQVASLLEQDERLSQNEKQPKLKDEKDGQA